MVDKLFAFEFQCRWHKNTISDKLTNLRPRREDREKARARRKGMKKAYIKDSHGFGRMLASDVSNLTFDTHSFDLDEAFFYWRGRLGTLASNTECFIKQTH